MFAQWLNILATLVSLALWPRAVVAESTKAPSFRTIRIVRKSDNHRTNPTMLHSYVDNAR